MVTDQNLIDFVIKALTTEFDRYYRVTNCPRYAMRLLELGLEETGLLSDNEEALVMALLSYSERIEAKASITYDEFEENTGLNRN